MFLFKLKGLNSENDRNAKTKVEKKILINAENFKNGAITFFLR
jgi:hypothetical protein